MDERAVSADILALLMENANWAPTHGKTEPWRFVVFTGEARGDLSDALVDAHIRARDEAGVDPNLPDGKLDKLRTVPLQAPACILVWMARQQKGKIPELEEVEAVACAIQNMHLTATSLGLGGFWSTPAALYHEHFKSWLAIGSEDRCLGLFYVGWPRPDFAWPEGSRRPVSDKIEWRGDGPS